MAALTIEDVLQEVTENHEGEQRDEEIQEQESLLKPAQEISRLIYGVSVNAGELYRHESELWLQSIFRRLAARRNIRKPHYSEISRHIPKEMFLALVRILQKANSPLFTEPNCYVSQNTKAIVVSFTTLESVRKFLESLSRMSEKNVLNYMERKLSGKRRGHSTRLLVSPTKDFALVYTFKKGLLLISFHFGEWNAYGFPQHSCEL